MVLEKFILKAVWISLQIVPQPANTSVPSVPSFAKQDLSVKQ